MKKWFTLIEIVLVLIVISVLIGIILRFGSNRIVDLKSQNNREQFISFYDNLYSSNLISNYHNTNRYEKLNIQIWSWIFFTYDDSNLQTDSNLKSTQIHVIGLDNQNVENVNLQLTPYNIGCEIFSKKDSSILTWNLISFQLFSQDNQKEYCFEIWSDTCKLIEKKCKDN